jgi:8-oxo-dGTP pyrophosphatase MutT (NUDIX family)
MGHIEPGETAIACAWRELREEIALTPGPSLHTLWALPSIRGFYLPSRDQVILPVPFLALISPAFTPTLNDEHTAWRFVRAADALDPDSPSALPWPAQRESLREALDELLFRAHTDAARAREIPPPQP